MTQDSGLCSLGEEWEVTGWADMQEEWCLDAGQVPVLDLGSDDMGSSLWENPT